MFLVFTTEPARLVWRWREAGEVAQGNDSSICSLSYVSSSPALFDWFIYCPLRFRDSYSTAHGQLFVHMLIISCMLSTTGSPKDQGNDDGVWDYDGGLPAARRQGQLLPHGHLQPCCYQVRHRLPDRGDRATGEWLVRSTLKSFFSPYIGLFRLWRAPSLASRPFCLIKMLNFSSLAMKNSVSSVFSSNDLCSKHLHTSLSE